MKAISREYLNILKLNDTRVNFLYTITFGYNLSATVSSGQHPATLSSSILIASGDGVAVEGDGGKEYFFKPCLLSNPEVQYSFSPQGKSSETQEVEIVIGRDSGFPFRILDNLGTLSLSLRVDSHIIGTPLSSAIPLFWGQVTSASYDRATNELKLQAKDGEPFREVRFANTEPITRAEFPDIPVTSDGRFNRQVALGEINYPILCPQIDNGTRFYILDGKISPNPPAHPFPFSVQVNGEDKSQNDSEYAWDIVEEIVPSPILTSLENRDIMSTIQFHKQIPNLELPFVTCSGFNGLSKDKQIILTLLDYAQYPVSIGARQILQNLPFDMSFFQNAQGNVLELVRDRLFPQTPYIMGFRNGEVVIFRMEGEDTGYKVGVGNGLIGRIDDEEDTPIDQVYNAIEIRYFRNIYTQKEFEASRLSYILDSDRANSGLQGVLKQSEAAYGRRYVQMEFADIVVNSQSGPPPIIPYFAENYLRLACKQHKKMSYLCEGWLAYSLIENSILYLTDEDRGMVDQKVRVIGRKVAPTLCSITFQTEL
jgi:hypothetical protein